MVVLCTLCGYMNILMNNEAEITNLDFVINYMKYFRDLLIWAKLFLTSVSFTERWNN